MRSPSTADGGEKKVANRRAEPFTFSWLDRVGSRNLGIGWHFVALTFTPGLAELYVDGNLDGSAFSGVGTHPDASIPLTLGAWSGDGHTYSGSAMHDFRVYDEVLTQQQVQALMIPEPSIAFTLALAVAGLAGRRHRRI